MTSTTAKRLPPDPRTIAEMIPVRRAEIAARNAQPRCHIEGHGVMPPRPLESQTYEQMWCGVWYDCQATQGTRRCGSSASYASRELAAAHGEPYVIRGGEYETWTGTEWQPITQAEFDAYWTARLAEMETRRQMQAAGARIAQKVTATTRRPRSRKAAQWKRRKRAEMAPCLMCGEPMPEGDDPLCPRCAAGQEAEAAR